MANFHIIGTGLSGLAAATSIARAGHHVQCYEAGNIAGGRCALLRDEHRNDGYDGCNALLFGGNKALRRYAEHIGSAHTLELLDCGGTVFDCKRKRIVPRMAFLLPPALPLLDLLTLVLMRFLPRGTVSDAVFNYYHPLSEVYIEPLCRGLMLSGAADTNAHTLAQRVWNIARTGKQGMRMLVPRLSLYHSLVEPALRQIELEGGGIYYGHALQKITCTNGAITGLHFTKHVKPVRADDRVIFALPAHVLQQLAPAAVPLALLQRNILTVHFHIGGEAASRIVPVIAGSVDWVRQHNGVISAVSYLPEPLLPLHDDTVSTRVWGDVTAALGINGTDMPAFRVVRSRRAHAAREGYVRLSNRYMRNGFLAGELFGDVQHVPLEAAVLSGMQAANDALASIVNA